VIGAYVWDKYKSKDKDDKTVKNKQVTLPLRLKKISHRRWLLPRVSFCRDLVNDNADTITSAYLEKTVRSLISAEKLFV